MKGCRCEVNLRHALRAAIVQRSVALVRFCVLLTVIGVLLSTTGCNYIPWPDTFGAVTPPNSKRSLNGLGVHKRMWETAGARVLTPQKLSPRLDDMEVLVLVGASYEPPGRLARDWLEQWLDNARGRTVIYFGRDFDAETLYREQTLAAVAPAAQDQAAEMLAVREAKQFVERLEQVPEDIFCRWFFLRTSARPIVQRQFTGAWASKLNELSGEWPIHTLLEPPESQLRNKKPSWLTGGAPPKLTPVQKLTSGDDAEQELGDKEVQRSVWQPNEIASDESWQSEWDAAGESEVLLAGADGEPLIHRLTSDKFGGSQILIVANGAPFLNGALVQPLHRKIGELIIAECLPAKRVGLVSYNQAGLLISQIDAGDQVNVGMELLTVWPLSAITMHAAFLGILLCFMLLPILGRPQGLPPRSVTDFGLHVEAMGQMLFESRDSNFAVRMIRNYFVKVRDETPPEWLMELGTSELISPIQSASLTIASQPPVSSEITAASTASTLPSSPTPPATPPTATAEVLPPSPTNQSPVDPLS